MHLQVLENRVKNMCMPTIMLFCLYLQCLIEKREYSEAAMWLKNAMIDLEQDSVVCIVLFCLPQNDFYTLHNCAFSYIPFNFIVEIVPVCATISLQ